MKVLIVNTSERTGGAAVAAGRLMEALNNHGVKARMMVREKETDSLCVTTTGHPRWRVQWAFLWERWCIFCRLRFSRRRLFSIDTGQCGLGITRTAAFREADVVHLHWVNQGMLSLADIRRILESGKPVVWTMHDIWPATAICHLTLGCHRFRTGCRQCPCLPGGGGSNDLAARVWRRKERMLRGQTVWFVACSKWLAGEARQSRLLQGQPVVSIPNPIDTRVFRPADRREARRRCSLPEQGRLVLFAAQRVSNENKGMAYLVEAMRVLAARHADLAAQTELVVVGGHGEDLAADFAQPVHAQGYVSDTARMVDLYNAADLFVLPSLSENLPNTIMEAMACGVPCVAFHVGGIPEEIDHGKNGYVARYRDADDLADGLAWVLNHEQPGELSRLCVAKVAACWSQQSVALRYSELYTQAIAHAHYRL